MTQKLPLILLTDDELSVMALQAGMRPADIIELLDTFARLRAMAPTLERIDREGLAAMAGKDGGK